MITKMLGLAKFALFCGVLFMSGMARAIINVPGDFSSIQAALNAAAVGETMNVGPGTYNEALTITQSVHLIGSGADVTTLLIPDGNWGIFVPGAARTSAISGLTITGFHLLGEIQGTAGIAIDGSRPDLAINYLNISKNHISDVLFGLVIQDSISNTLIDDNLFENIGGWRAIVCQVWRDYCGQFVIVMEDIEVSRNIIRNSGTMPIYMTNTGQANEVCRTDPSSPWAVFRDVLIEDNLIHDLSDFTIGREGRLGAINLRYGIENLRIKNNEIRDINGMLGIHIGAALLNTTAFNGLEISGNKVENVSGPDLPSGNPVGILLRSWVLDFNYLIEGIA